MKKKIKIPSAFGNLEYTKEWGLPPMHPNCPCLTFPIFTSTELMQIVRDKIKKEGIKTFIKLTIEGEDPFGDELSDKDKEKYK